MPDLFILLYKAQCGDWYVHSHKLYPSDATAREKARKFLPPGSEIAIVPLGAAVVDAYIEHV